MLVVTISCKGRGAPHQYSHAALRKFVECGAAVIALYVRRLAPLTLPPPPTGNTQLLPPVSCLAGALLWYSHAALHRYRASQDRGRGDAVYMYIYKYMYIYDRAIHTLPPLVLCLAGSLARGRGQCVYIYIYMYICIYMCVCVYMYMISPFTR